VATLPEEEVEEEAELRQEKENGSVSIKVPTTGGDFTTNSGMTKPNGMTNGNGVVNGHYSDEVVPLANGDDPHVDRNDPNFLIPPRFNPQGANPPLENGLPIAGITHPGAAVVPAHIHAATDTTHLPGLTQQQSQPRLSMDAINRMSQDGTSRSRKSLDEGQGSKRNMQMGGSSRKKVGRGVSLSQMMSQKSMQAGKGQVAGGSKGMVLPFEPLCLTFSDLNYYVDLPKVGCLLCLASSFPSRNFYFDTETSSLY